MRSSRTEVGYKKKIVKKYKTPATLAKQEKEKQKLNLIKTYRILFEKTNRKKTKKISKGGSLNKKIGTMSRFKI